MTKVTKVTNKFFYAAVLFLLFAVNAYSTTISVSVANFSFTPATVTALVGDTIRWNWVGGNHTTTCDGSSLTSRPAGAASWNNAINSGSPLFKYVITVAGTYNYKCAIHGASMLGVINASAPAINLNLTSIIEGFWNGTTMVGDTAKVFLRNSTTPFAKVDSAKVKLSTSGTGTFLFTHAATGSYYIVVTHRNSIDTWSKTAQSLSTGGTLSYDFTIAADQAFGNNLILKSGKYTIISGDVNLDGFVNLNDITITFNNSSNFVNGYVETDVNGDNLTNLNDITIAYNNSAVFAAIMRP